jgi:hypothetical protein
MKGQNNPLNIRRVPGQRWLGSMPGTGAFEDFSDPKWCYRAAHRIVLKHWVEGNTLVSDVVAHWAPASENPTKQYIANVCGWMGHDPDASLTKDQIPFLFHAMTRQEQGTYPYPDDNPIYAGIELDGGAPPPLVVHPVFTPPEPPPVPEPTPTPPPGDVPNPFTPSQSTTVSVGGGGALAIVLMWALGLAHIPVTPEAAMALGVILSSLAGYVAKGGRAIHTQGV